MLQVLLTLTTVTISLIVFLVEAPGGSLALLYLWVAPHRLGLFPRRQAALQSRPDPRPIWRREHRSCLVVSGTDARTVGSRWFLATSTVLAVGILARPPRRAAPARPLRF
jgi:hypothetical protein